MSVTRVHTARALDEPLCIALATKPTDIIENGDMDDEVGLMRWGSNYTFLVNIIRADIRVLAIYKPRQRRAPALGLPRWQPLQSRNRRLPDIQGAGLGASRRRHFCATARAASARCSYSSTTTPK